MKLCPECHRLSKDDDFCSHCGSAVYGNDNISTGTLSCDDIDGHSHEKTTYSQPQNYTRTSGYNGKDFTNAPDPPKRKPKQKKPVGCIVTFIVIAAILSALEDEGISLSELLYKLQMFLEQILE
ncbi:MAG: hypothetical protein ACI4Q6_10700 [Huintestinicola sp.]